MVSTKTRMMAALAIPAALILSACKMDADIVVEDPNNITISFSFEVENPKFSVRECDKIIAPKILEDRYKKGALEEPPTFESIPVPNGMGCKINFKLGSKLRAAYYSNNNGGHSFELPASVWKGFNTAAATYADEAKASTFRTAITLPGKIKTVTKGGTFKGNTAVWEGFETVNQGFGASTLAHHTFKSENLNPDSLTLTEEPEESPSSIESPDRGNSESPSFDSSAKTKDSSDSEGKSSIGITAGIITAVLAVIVGVILGIIRSKKKKTGLSPYGPSQRLAYPQEQAYAPGQGQTYGQPQGSPFAQTDQISSQPSQNYTQYPDQAGQGQPFGQANQGSQPYGNTGQPYGQPGQHYGQGPQ